MDLKDISLKVILLVLNFHLNNAFPAPASPPETKLTCNVDRAFFNHLKKAITDVIKSREEILLETSGQFGDCREDLNEIVTTLKQIHHETTLVRKGGVPVEDLEELKESFEEKMADFIRVQDIFRKDFNAQQLRVKGELYDKVHALRVEIRELEEDIRKTEEEYLATVFELIKTSLKSGFQKEKAKNYVKTIPEDKLCDLIIYVQEDHKIVNEALNLLAKINADKEIIPTIRKCIENENIMEKDMKEILLQWANRAR